MILFTSGTTGPSKGVVLSHNANFRLCRNVCEIMAYERDEVLFTAFPLFHVNAKYTTVLPALYVGGEVVMRPRFSASRFWDICREEGVTAFNFMGALLMMLHKQPPKPHDRDHKVAKAYGAPAPVTIFDDFQERFGVRLVEVYGSTELGTATGNTVHESKVGSCGVPAPHYEVEIHDEHDNPVPPGTEGEICVRPEGARRDDPGVLPDAGGDAEGLPQPVVPHRRPRPHGRGRPLLLRRPHEGRDPPARREHLVAGRSRSPSTPTRRCRRPR